MVSFSTGFDLKSHYEQKMVEAGIQSQSEIADHMASYVLQFHANSTVKKYKGYFNTFKKFCNLHSLCENPANPMTVATCTKSFVSSQKT